MQTRAGLVVMQGIALQVLGWTIQDFIAKGRHGADEAGNVWAPIKRESIAGRLLKRKVGEPVRRLLRRGSGSREWNAKIIYLAANDPDAFPEFYDAVNREFASYEIGRDTNRLLGSIVAGVPSGGALPVIPIRYTSEAPAQAIWEVQPKQVTLGTRQSYASHFARRRPIFPPNWMTERRANVLRVMVTRLFLAALKGDMQGGSGSR